MDYRIETKEAFDVYGIEGIFTMKDGENLKAIPAFWMECMKDGRFQRLIASTHGESNIHAVCGYRDVHMGPDKFPYMLFAFKTANSDAAGFTQVTVPATTWAVFRSEQHTLEGTSGAIQGLIKRVYTEWLPTASYNKADGCELELYFDAGFGMFYSETWIMVTPK